MNKEFIKEIKDTYREENKDYTKQNDVLEKKGYCEMTDEDFHILQGWVEALEYVLNLAKKKGLDK